jgi:hypothetical protein
MRRSLNEKLQGVPYFLSHYRGSSHGFSPTSVQFKSEINDALPRKRHQKRHLEFCTALLLSRGLEVRSPPGAHIWLGVQPGHIGDAASSHSSHQRTMQKHPSPVPSARASVNNADALITIVHMPQAGTTSPSHGDDCERIVANSDTTAGTTDLRSTKNRRFACATTVPEPDVFKLLRLALSEKQIPQIVENIERRK